jgi:hypothetical protein
LAHRVISLARSKLVAFGAKRTCAAATAGPRAALMTHSGHRPDRNSAMQQRRPMHGYATTREEAMTAFAKSWRRE